MSQLAIVVLLVGGVVAVGFLIIFIARPNSCKHRSIGTGGLVIGGLFECRECGQILTWQEVSER